MGDLYKQGRETAKYATGHPDGYVPNSRCSGVLNILKEISLF